jgi:hypothetical protein
MFLIQSFIQTLINESTSIGSTYDEQLKALESICIEEYRDLSVDRIQRMIRSMLKSRKSYQSPALHQVWYIFLKFNYNNICFYRIIKILYPRQMIVLVVMKIMVKKFDQIQLQII